MPKVHSSRLVCRHANVAPIYYLDDTATSDTDAAEVVANLDPIFVAIEAFKTANNAHVQACAEYGAAETKFLETYGTMSPRRALPYYNKNVRPAEQASEHACHAETVAFDELVTTVPTTAAGLSALLKSSRHTPARKRIARHL